MKTTKRSLTPTTLVLLAVFVLAAGSALAQGTGGRGQGPGCTGPDFRGGPGDRAEMRLERMTERLDLSDEQVQAIKEIKEGNQEKNTELRKELMRLRNELDGEWLQDQPSEKTIIALTEKIGEFKTQMQVNRVKTRLAVGNQLTSDQRDKMLVMRSRHGRGGPSRGCSDQDGHGRRGGARSQGGPGGRWKM